MNDQRPRRPQGRPPQRRRPPQNRPQNRPQQRQDQRRRRPPQQNRRAPEGYYNQPPYEQPPYEQPKPKKRFKWWYIPIGIIVIAILAGIFSGGDDDKPKKADQNNDRPAAEQPADADDQTTFAVGDSVDIGKAIITVTNVERDPTGEQYNEPPEGKEFLHVQLQIENTGDRNYQLYPYNQKIRTSNGELLTFDVFASAIKESESMEMIEIAPGGKTTGWISFSIPKDDDVVFMYFDNVLLDTPTFEVPIN